MAQLISVFRIGRDAELRHTAGGDPVVSLSLAYNYGRKGDDGNKPSQWIDATLWGKRAESLAPHLKKGQQVYCVINEPHIETYQKNDGSQGFKLAGTIAEIEFVGGKSEGSSQSSGQGDYAKAKSGGESAKPNARKQNFDDMDSDIPF
jgi:single-strand DNA-binding protein